MLDVRQKAARLQGSGNKGWHIARGPLSVIFGIGLGIIAAVFCSFTKLWNTSYKRSFILVASGALLLYAALFQILHADSRHSALQQTCCCVTEDTLSVSWEAWQPWKAQATVRTIMRTRL